jgi:hypothetical protein
MPFQPPEAVHEVAFVDDQESVGLPLAVTVVGLAERVTVGAGGGGAAATLTVTVCVADAPPAPEHTRLKAVLCVSAPVDAEPEVAREPVQPPEAVQEVAFELAHCSMADCPEVNDVGEAVNCVICAAGGVGALTSTCTERWAEPPAPAQDSVKVALAASPLICWLPLVDFVPLQPPEAVHEVACSLDHESVVAAPLAMEVGDAESVTVAIGGSSLRLTS